MGVVANVLEDTSEEGREGGDFAGAEEVEGVGLDEGRPVALVGVKGVKEDFLDSGGGGVNLVGRRGSLVWCLLLLDVAVFEEVGVDLGPQVGVEGCG